MRLLITRPWEDAESLSAALKDCGVDVLVAPLLEIEYLPGPRLDLGDVQALLATSANGVRAFVARDSSRHLPVFAVGDATARTAGEAGFSAVESAAGDVATLSELVKRLLAPESGVLLHVAGTKLAGDLGEALKSAGYAYRRLELYRARAADALPPAVAEAIRRGFMDGVVVYSPRTAKTLVGLIHNEDLTVACRRLKMFCLSQAVAKQASGVDWRQVFIAARPDQSAMIDAILAAQE